MKLALLATLQRAPAPAAPAPADKGGGGALLSLLMKPKAGDGPDAASGGARAAAPADDDDDEDDVDVRPSMQQRAAPTSAAADAAPMSRESLRAIFLEMLDDENFVGALHERYLATLRRSG